jgi:hypothetical protein
MNLPKIARLAALSLIVFVTVLTSFASAAGRPCGCNYCSQVSPETNCSLDGTTTTCGYFLSVALCPAS